MAERGEQKAKDKQAWRCRWHGHNGRCCLAGTVDGFCLWHAELRTHGLEGDTYDEFAAWREQKLEARADLRWALYSARDWWALLNGDADDVATPKCEKCGRACLSNADYSTVTGLAPPPAEAIHEAGTVVCVRCGPNPAHVERQKRSLEEKAQRIREQQEVRANRGTPGDQVRDDDSSGAEVGHGDR